MPVTKAKKAEIVNRRKTVAANLLAGMDYRDMAAALNVSIGTIASDVKAILNQWNDTQQKTIDRYAALEVKRLDMMINAIWDRAVPPPGTQQDLNAVDRVLKIMERRAKLLGLDAPTKQEMSGPHGGPIPVSQSSVQLDVDDETKRRIAEQYLRRFTPPAGGS